MKKVCTLCGILASVLALFATDASAATKKKTTTTKQSTIQKGTSVRAKVTASNLYDQECYEAFYGCMDQFCISDTSNGGSCTCSDLSLEYEKKFAKVQDKMIEAERIATEEVERVQAGADADIIFTGKREYDEDGNIADIEQEKQNEKDKKRKELLAMFDNDWYGDEDEEELVDLSELLGDELFSAAEELCIEQVPESCESDLTLLRQMYSRQIVSDCKAFENTIAAKELEADRAMTAAEGAVRAALKESFDSANKYDLGTCMVEFKKCMRTEDACGENWENCVSTIASENMQNEKTQSVAGTKVETINTYDITASTMEILDSKRIICERVLDNCVAVRDNVWPAFLREAAPTIKVAESNAESRMRQSCLTNISNCIQKACKDDIVGKGKDTMDACLSRPDMARSFCKVEIDPCERMEPLIWGYVVDKLAAMRVDACTQEVKDCITADTRCGEDYSNCIGMDYEYLHDICPIDSLVVCKANNPKFSMDDLDSMLMGLFLNIDNSALENCQEIVDNKMAEICGSTTDCNVFASDELIGTGSLFSQKLDDVYRVTGMISFGNIKMGSASVTQDEDEKLHPGQIGVKEYLSNLRAKNSDVKDSAAIISSIESELENIAGTINRTIELIELDPKVQFCISGRDLSQITGKKNEKTSARFPNLLSQKKVQIAAAALRKAQDNYNAKFQKLVAEATKDADADLAQYMCQKIAETGAMTLSTPSTDLMPPYAIAYEVGAGLTSDELSKGGKGVLDLGGAKFSNTGYLGGGQLDADAGIKETTAVFNRETRTCHVCTTTITQSCKTTGSTSWFHNSRNTSCTTNEPVEKCEDIPM